MLDRQITGQLSIEDILSDWEVKKRQTEAAIAEAAKRDEERRRERERLRATGQLPDLKVEVKTTVPEEIQRLIEEIEGRYPVRVELEPVGKKEPDVEKETAGTGKEPQEILGILEAAEGGPQEILEILEEPSLREEGQKVPAAREKRLETEARKAEKTEEAASPMLESLEKSLEETISTLPPGQLSEEQKKLFAYFTSVRGMNRQLRSFWRRTGCVKTAGKIPWWEIL